MMKSQSLLLALLSATFVSSLSVFGSDGQQTLDETFKVPGDNPLEFCQDPKDYILDVTRVDLLPNPPVPGQNLQIVGNGTFSEDVEEGAYVLLQVKYNRFITLLNTKQDLCENLPKIDLECPLKKGDLSIHKGVDIPKAVPPGQYDVLATIKSKDEKEIVCMKATVHFTRGG